MRKFLFIAVIVLAASLSSNAQVGTLTWSGFGNTLDTVTNAGTKYAGVTIGATPPKAFNFLIKVTKISGTVGGTISWQGSNNGTDYVTISTSSPSDASANYQYSVSGWTPFKYYRVSWTGTGTMSASVQGTYYRVW